MSSAVQVDPERYLRSAPGWRGPSRWDRVLGLLLVALWLAAAALAWGGGRQEVSLDRLEADVAAGDISWVQRSESLAGSSWLSARDPDQASGQSGGGLISYRSGTSLLGRTYVVLPDGSAAPHDLSAARATWSQWGDEADRAGAAVERADDQVTVRGATWLPGGVMVLLLSGGLVATIGTMVASRPRSGTFWFWLWPALVLPAGVGWLTFAWVEHLRPRAGDVTRARRGGWEGLAWSIVGAGVLALLWSGLRSLLGIAVLPL